MSDASRRSVKVHGVFLGALLLGYAVWAAFFIARSSVELGGSRYFCLFDDAMVSLRYAWNFAHGQGLVWNPGERVEGSTSFLLTLYMSFGALLLGKSGAVLFVQITGVALVMAAALLARELGRALGASRPLGLVTAAAILAYYPLSYWSLMGMETGMLSVLALFALVLALRLGAEPQGSKLLGAALGLMFMTRPDAVVPAALILVFRAIWILRRDRRLGALKPWLIEAALFTGIGLALSLFRLAYYGSVFPNTYYLKLAGWSALPRLQNGWRFIEPFLDSSRYLLLLALAGVVLARDGRRLLLFCFALALLACQVWVGGDAWGPYWRMVVPGALVAIVLAVDGSAELVRRITRSEKPVLVTLLGLACCAGALWVADEPFYAEQLLQKPAFQIKLNQRMVEAGVELPRYADRRASVAVMAAGTVPYYSGLRGIDVLGKSDRTIARLPKDPRHLTVVPGHDKYDLHYSITKLRPDVIYDALRWARYHPGIFEFVAEHYVRAGAFWLRRDSTHVYWDRLPRE
jgi:arabinofuranosyltransferase